MALLQASERQALAMPPNALAQGNDPDLESLVIRAIGLDESSGGDALDSVELQSALRQAVVTISTTKKAPFKLDLLGFDACLMAGLEVAFQIEEFSSYMVGSEEIEPVPTKF